MDFIKRNILTDSFLLANIINTFLGCLEYQPMPSITVTRAYIVIDMSSYLFVFIRQNQNLYRLTFAIDKHVHRVTHHPHHYISENHFLHTMEQNVRAGDN